MKSFKLLFYACLVVLIAGCSVANVDCPSPEIIKLKKMQAHRMRYYRHLQKEKALERETAIQYEAMRRIPRDGKKSEELEEWDCPRPGTTKHQRLIREKRRKLDKMHDKKKSENALDEISERADARTLE